MSRLAKAFEINSRYVAYAKAHGKTVDQMRDHDKTAWPGGCATGFILWVGDRWRAWDQMRKQGRDHVRSDQEHRSFDAWLASG